MDVRRHLLEVRENQPYLIPYGYPYRLDDVDMTRSLLANETCCMPGSNTNLGISSNPIENFLTKDSCNGNVMAGDAHERARASKTLISVISCTPAVNTRTGHDAVMLLYQE